MINHVAIMTAFSIAVFLGLVGCSQPSANKDAGAASSGDEECKKAPDEEGDDNKSKGKNTKSSKSNKSAEKHADDESDTDSDEEEASQQRPSPTNNKRRGGTGDEEQSNDRNTSRLALHGDANHELSELGLTDSPNGIGHNLTTNTGTDESTTTSAVTYESDIKKILEASCVDCHKVKSVPLTTWADVEKSKVKIVTRISNKSMPPPDDPTTVKLTDAQIALVNKWKDGGYLQAPPAGGDPQTGMDDPKQQNNEEAEVDQGDPDGEVITAKKSKPKKNQSSSNRSNSSDDDGCKPKQESSKTSEKSTKSKATKSTKQQKSDSDDDAESNNGSSEQDDD